MIGNLIVIGVAFLLGYGAGYTDKDGSSELDDLCKKAEEAHNAAEAVEADDAEQEQQDPEKEEG
jgi:hypothetical protein